MITLSVRLYLGQTVTVEECARVAIEVANWLQIPHSTTAIGMDGNGQPYAGLTVVRDEHQAVALTTARNLIDRLAIELPNTAQHVRQVAATWRETHSGINILGSTERHYDLRCSY